MEIVNNLYKNNEMLSQILQKNNINQLVLTSLGNSIASGYSYMSTTKPLLYRDETIETIMATKNITLNRYHFARYANNNDEHIFSWLTKNISEKEMYNLNRIDIKHERVIGLTNELIEKYYPTNPKENLGLRNIILQNNPNLANIVIYNGATGSFLDNITRNGKHKLTSGIKRDCVSIESTLKTIQISNRTSGTNTQVYLCGAPKILNTPITDIYINNRLEKIASNYANVTYIPPISRKVIYKHPEYGISPDTHYNEEEYLTLLTKIIESINQKYLMNKAMIDIDREFFSTSYQIEEGQKVDKDYIIEEKLSNWITILDEQGLDINQFLSTLKKYLLERQPYDFYYLGNKTIKKHVNQLKK